MSKNFGDHSSVEALKWLKQYKRLEKKKEAGLSPSEENTYEELRAKLAKLMDPKKPNPLGKARFPTKVKVHFRSGKELKAAYMHNISGGGVYIATEDPKKVGSKIEVEIELQEEKKSQSFSGEVAWVNTRETTDLKVGMGVKFLNLSPDQTNFLREFVHAQLTKSKS